jgi:hypothetical protein
MRKWLGIGFVTMLLTMTLGIIRRSLGIAQPASEWDITLVNIEFEGTKIWIPGPVAVKKDDTVKINAINNVKSDRPSTDSRLRFTVFNRSSMSASRKSLSSRRIRPAFFRSSVSSTQPMSAPSWSCRNEALELN